jgi:phosphate:Na+ symporter
MFEVKESRDRHLMRFYHHIAAAESGPILLNMLIQLERISDHCQYRRIDRRMKEE